MDRNDGTLGQDAKIAVGDHGRDLEDTIGRGVEPRHLEIEPDQIILVLGQMPALLRLATREPAAWSNPAVDTMIG
jgi:hypothetical protein